MTSKRRNTRRITITSRFLDQFWDKNKQINRVLCVARPAWWGLGLYNSPTWVIALLERHMDVFSLNRYNSKHTILEFGPRGRLDPDSEFCTEDFRAAMSRATRIAEQMPDNARVDAILVYDTIKKQVSITSNSTGKEVRKKATLWRRFANSVWPPAVIGSAFYTAIMCLIYFTPKTNHGTGFFLYVLLTGIGIIVTSNLLLAYVYKPR